MFLKKFSRLFRFQIGTNSDEKYAVVSFEGSFLVLIIFMRIGCPYDSREVFVFFTITLTHGPVLPPTPAQLVTFLVSATVGGSGLAIGIDGAAHRAAVAAGGTTIAVLPSPLDRIYPPRHRQLARNIVAGGGALVTEIPIGAVVGKPDFARRNRIIAGLAEAVVVVEAPDRSGALLTAAAAAAAGRELYAVPGPIDAMASRGCNRLIADHQASIVTSSAALLAQIGLHRRARPAAVETLSEVEGMVLGKLLERSGSIEELVDRAHQPPAAVASALAMLEARGLVDSFGGATFHPTVTARRMAGVA